MAHAKKKTESIFFTDGRMLGQNLEADFFKALEFLLVKDRTTVAPKDSYIALAASIKQRLIRKWLKTQNDYVKSDVKQVYYLSLEFLMGRMLGNTLVNMDYYTDCFNILADLGYSLEDIRELEPDMGLGNGGLGRLAACFLDSMATMGIPACGYGIRYEYGMFRQIIKNGWQEEMPDNWLRYGSPWEIQRPGLEYRIRFGGRVISARDDLGNDYYQLQDTEDVQALAYDIPVPGYANNTVNTLRLWQAKSTNEFDFAYFNSGDYLAAVENKNHSENISKVLYPNDNVYQGKILRLKQQYFFVSATLQDILCNYKLNHEGFKEFPNKVAIQLNDTHPVIAIPELLHLLLDEERLCWDDAWDITWKTFAYTNHTVLPEALEKWDVELFSQLLPRHLQLIYEINWRFLNQLRAGGQFSDNELSVMSIIEEGPVKKVRMANLAIIGSHSINGVSELHTSILKQDSFRSFFQVYPERFNNKTNGITPRRWLKKANPLMSTIITDTIGGNWVSNLAELKKLEKHVEEPEFRQLWQEAKWGVKKNLASYIQKETGLTVDPDSLFDVQVKRLHEYKRQLLNVMHVITLYNRILDNPSKDIVPRTFIFAGKAAPGYLKAKLVIKLINSAASVVNNDKLVAGRLKMVFLENYSVSLAERIIPAADLSEQISTAGYEASGTGNMKFMANGALTIGTYDGANIEMAEELGAENIFIFGLTDVEIRQLKQNGYQPYDYYERNGELKKVINQLSGDFFNSDEPGIFKPLIDDLLIYGDNYCLLADYESYIKTQEEVDALFRQQEEWTRRSIINTARCGRFSSDRTIAEYARDIWQVQPLLIEGE